MMAVSDKTETELLSRLTEGAPSDSAYKKFYVTNFMDVPGNDYCIMQHSNKVCLVYLAETHSVVKHNKDVVKVQFSIKCSPEDYKVSGKGKSAERLSIGSSLCKISTTDDTDYDVVSCVRGNLIEVNENLLANPNLIKMKHNSDGYLVIIQPKFKDVGCMAKTVMEPEQYQQLQEGDNAAINMDTKDSDIKT